jgi:GTP cyclohydrolase IA
MMKSSKTKELSTKRKKNEARNKIACHVRGVLECLAELYPSLDVECEDFRETPERVARAYEEFCQGCDQESVAKILKKEFPKNYTGIVHAIGIDASGLCPHHFLPVLYSIDFGYLPDKNVVGLSKISRFLKAICKQPDLQENITQGIITTFDKIVKPAGSMVIVRAVHTCVCTRGVMDNNVQFVTSYLSGCFMDDPTIKSEFLSLVQSERERRGI